MNDIRFPIHREDVQKHSRKHPTWPVSVPWKIVEPHRLQAQRNHSQTLERLAGRGGLSWLELYAVLTDASYREATKNLTSVEDAVEFICQMGGLIL